MNLNLLMFTGLTKVANRLSLEVGIVNNVLKKVYFVRVGLVVRHMEARAVE